MRPPGDAAGVEGSDGADAAEKVHEKPETDENDSGNTHQEENKEREDLGAREEDDVGAEYSSNGAASTERRNFRSP